MESISRPVQRNFPRKRSNSNISSKHAYDDVFAGPRKFAAPTFSSRVEDYAEIFGTSRASSIPVLDLDDSNAGLPDFRNSTPADYSSIFAGFDVGISYDELFAEPKPETSSSPKTRTQAATKSPNQNSDISGSLEEDKSFDEVKQFNMSYHKTSQKVKDDTKVTTHVAELRAVPGFTCFIDETAPLDKIEDDKQKSPAINDVRQKMDFGNTTSPPAKKQTKRGFVRSKNGSSWDGTYSNDKLFRKKHEVPLKSQPSKSEKLNDEPFKKSTTAVSKKEVPRTETRDCSRSLDSSDEELDVNSAAAASITALRKAIEKAQESIRIAKGLMDHQKEGVRVLVVKGSKSSSKVKDRMENGIAPRRNRSHEEKNEGMRENMHISNAAENCEVATRFCKVVDYSKHRRAMSAFEQVDRYEDREMPEGNTQKEEVVVEATELKEDRDREESGFKISEHQEENSNKTESSFVVHKPEEKEGKGNSTYSSEVKVEALMETIEDEEFFESEDWDAKDQEERVNRSLELVEENEHKPEVVLEQEIVREKIKDTEIEENDEQVLVKRLEEAFKRVENEIQLREVVDGYSNELKQKDECVGEIIETEAQEEKETAEDIQNKDIKSEENEGIMQVDEKRQKDASDLKESEENTSARKLEEKETVVEGASGYEGDENVQKESDEIEESKENWEIGVNEKSPTDGNDGEESEENMKAKMESSVTEENDEIKVVFEEEEEKEEALHSNRVSDASNSSTSTAVEEEADKHEINEISQINNDIVKASPRVSDVEFNENSSFESSTESEIGENQAEQNTEESELASDLEYGSDILVSDLRETDAIIKEYREEIKTVGSDEEIRNEDVVKNEESNNKSLATEEKEKDDTASESKEEKDNAVSASKEEHRVTKEANKREKEQEKKDRLVVERAIREARERAFAEAKERAERAAVEKVNAEIRKRVMAEARDKLEKASSSSSSSSSYQKASQDAKLKAERAAVERATLEARKRALEKALSQKNCSEARPQQVPDSDSQGLGGTNSESYLRSKAKLEKHQRIMQRAAKALAEKNQRDLLAQNEQAERNRLSASLDADIKRWSSGKEGNLRALLSTLQHILGPASGWQPVSLTDIITTSAVKKAYRKATLYVHPDKLQQRGATIPQKYICEKVFDLLKAAWNKFNAEER